MLGLEPTFLLSLHRNFRCIKRGEAFIREYPTLGDNKRICIGVTRVKYSHHNYDIVSRAIYTLDKVKEQNVSAIKDDNILENMKAYI